MVIEGNSVTVATAGTIGGVATALGGGVEIGRKTEGIDLASIEEALRIPEMARN